MTAHPRRRHIHATHTLGERLADAIAEGMGSWRFIIIQSAIVLGWIVINLAAFIGHWDPYPFILLNLLFSTQAAYAAPVIMMSQNRQAAKDRIRDDTEAREVDDMFRINQQQMQILEQQNQVLDQQSEMLTLLKQLLEPQGTRARRRPE